MDHHKSSDECVKRRHDGHHLSFSFHVTGNCCAEKNVFTELKKNFSPTQGTRTRTSKPTPCEKNFAFMKLPHHGVPGTTFRTTSETIIPFNQPHKQLRYVIDVHFDIYVYKFTRWR